MTRYVRHMVWLRNVRGRNTAIKACLMEKSQLESRQSSSATIKQKVPVRIIDVAAPFSAKVDGHVARVTTLTGCPPLVSYELAHPQGAGQSNGSNAWAMFARSMSQTMSSLTGLTPMAMPLVWTIACQTSSISMPFHGDTGSKGARR